MLTYVYYAIVLFIGLVLLFGLVAVKDILFSSKLAHIPGPPGYPLLGTVPYLLKAPWLTFYHFYLRYGKVYKISMFGKQMLVISDPVRNAKPGRVGWWDAGRGAGPGGMCPCSSPRTLAAAAGGRRLWPALCGALAAKQHV